MQIEQLVKMANQIASFFEAYPDKELAVAEITNHLSKFWEPRMRKQIIAYVQGGGEGLHEAAKLAVGRL